jgi:hypothetical protein
MVFLQPINWQQKLDEGFEEWFGFGSKKVRGCWPPFPALKSCDPGSPSVTLMTVGGFLTALWEWCLRLF